jgi:hypothetical protein
MSQFKQALANHMLVPVVAVLLVTAQATWGSAIKNQRLLEGSLMTVASNLITSPRIWAGVMIYIAATGVYFALLAKARFFSVQLTMTATAIILSTLLAAVFFHERLSMINLMGMLLVLVGLGLVMAR